MKREILQINSILGDWKIVALQYVIFFFSPIAWLVVGVGVMVTFDWIAGVAVAKKRREKIMSGGIYRTFIKFMLYSIGIVATRFMEILLRDQIQIPFASLLAGFILVIEYKSVMENISIATGVNLWTWIKDKIGDIHPKSQKEE